MQDRFLRYMLKVDPTRNKRYLVAVSGGLDSVVLAHLLYRHDFDFAVAHCNFQLRGADSEADEKWVKTLADTWKVKAFVKRCPVNSEANVQLKARELRYAFFEEIREKHSFDFILTAHHADDQLETFFINLLRGTGLDGLTGINDTEVVLRPLKNIFREELETYARETGLKWREDLSNAEDKYLRNKIRHKLLPLMQDLRPGFKDNLLKTIHILRSEKEVSKDWFEAIANKIIHKEKSFEWIWKKDLPEDGKQRIFLWRWLREYGFKDKELMDKITDLPSGRKMESEDYVFRVTKEKIYLYQKSGFEHKSLIFKTLEELSGVLGWTVKILDEVPGTFKKASPYEAYFDAGKFVPPYEMRSWRDGDRFIPLGMSGHKKVSDFLTDLQYPPPLRNEIKVLLSNGEIAWLPGLRTSELFKITDKTKRVVYIKIPK